ncbi:hypothetical protein AKO1_008320 [Acrasis kona]|uniref:Uncharacterized protein n=1 Tax=Acrasis kona TaxID=1008807 RepID=A0AAW2YPE2_9EUKA
MKSIFVVLLVAVFVAANSLVKRTLSHNENKVDIELFVMSKCPDVQDFNKHIFKQLYAELNSIMNIKVNFIAKLDDSQKYGFKSLHGVSEVEGDLIEACVQDQYKKENEFYKLNLCVNPKMPYLPSIAQQCIKEVGFDNQRIQACAFSEEGKHLLAQSINETDAKNVKWSPTMLLNGESYCEYGGDNCKATSYKDYVRDICKASTAEKKPPACSQ